MSARVKRRVGRGRLGGAVFGVAAGALIAGGALMVWAASLKMPDLQSFEERRVRESTKIYDRTGAVLLFDVHEDIRRTVVPFDRISRHIKNATVAIEDEQFYEHRGVRPTAIIRAMLVNIGSFDFAQGGSTITQQVVKNSILIADKKISRKLKEWVLAVKLDRALSKEEILAHYLNETPYGGSVYGVEEASQSFFGVPASAVSIAQAAYLAAIPQAPTYYSPYGNNQDALEARKNLVLGRMAKNGFITEEERAAATAEKVTFAPPATLGIRAPHFVMFVREHLERAYGREAVESRGLRVVTTLDARLQAIAEEIVARSALANEKKFNAENAGLVAIDPTTGEILAMVGSRNYFDEKIDGNFNVTIARRQPGSAFKPFVYATAFKEGLTPETVVFDLETEFSAHCTPDGAPRYPGAECYSPGNYDNLFRGPISLRNALAQSVNIPAVKVLYLAGIHDSLRTARDLGITTLTDPARYGLTLVLGGGEVSLLEMTSAYGVFANEGVRNPPVAIRSVHDKTGTVLEEYTPRPTQALDRGVSLTISDILADNEARAPAFGDSSFLNFPSRDVAVKTGTTNDYRDAWIVGYTPQIAVGAWAGNNDNRPMEKRVAGFIVAPLWNEFMREALRDIPAKSFPPPPTPTTPAEKVKPILRGEWRGGVAYTTDRVSKKMATEQTPADLRELKVVFDPHTILYWVDPGDITGPPPKNPADDPQFISWEYAVERWVAARGFVRETTAVIPRESDDVHTPDNAPRLSLAPDIPERLAAGSTLHFSVSAQGPYTPLSRVEIFLNGTVTHSKDAGPFSFSFDPRTAAGFVEGANTLTVAGYDSVANRGETKAVFYID